MPLCHKTKKGAIKLRMLAKTPGMIALQNPPLPKSVIFLSPKKKKPSHACVMPKKRVRDSLPNYPSRDLLVVVAKNTVAVLDRRMKIAPLDQEQHIPKMC